MISKTKFSFDVVDTGIFVPEERDENGCDDIILRTFELAPKDTTYLRETTCNLTEVGIFENTGDGGFVTSKYIDHIREAS
mgnify:CR=1 FL=1